MKNDNQIALAGFDVAILGMETAIAHLQEQLARYRALRAGIASGLPVSKPRRGRAPLAEYVEMDRAAGRKLHPRDKRHPDHEAYVAKAAEAHRGVWAAMTPKQRKARLAAMAAGRVRKEAERRAAEKKSNRAARLEGRIKNAKETVVLVNGAAHNHREAATQ